uniref:UBA domain-containing protein n=1 Tax=Timema poppense TaxID=170557 RepID=A0A7R9GSK1_TIMPO|nr:unnamed protein product [Timema poppensis]
MLPWVREKLFGSRQKIINILNRRCESETRRDVPTNEDMFVSDSNLFTNDLVKLKVVNLEGYVWDVDAPQDFTMDKLKTMALCHFYNPLESVKVTPNFRLVLVSERRSLGNDNTVFQEGLKSCDELLLVECRRPLAKEPSNDESLRGPTDEEIKAATQHVEPKNISKQHPPLECTADSEIRKILISLVEASARILTPSPNADEVFAVIRERLESKSSGKTEPDILSVKQLVDMGFSEQQASEALRRNRMNQTEALDWLLEQQSDSASPRSEPPASSTVVASSSKYRHELVKQLSHTESKQQCVSKTVASLLESFRAFKRSDFKPNEKALKNLVEMGFSEQDVKDALHITGNNQSSATISDSMATVTGHIGGDKELMLFKKKRAAIRASFTKIVKTTTDLFSVDSEKDLVTIETNHQLLQGKSSELSNPDEKILNSLFESDASENELSV